MPLDCSFCHRNVITFPLNIWDRPEVMVHAKSTPWYTAKCVHLHQMFCYNPSVAVQYIFSKCFIVTCQFMSNYTAITQFIAPGRNNYHKMLYSITVIYWSYATVLLNSIWLTANILMCLFEFVFICIVRTQREL